MVASRARADARRYAPLAYARTKGAFHVQPAMAVTKSHQKSSASSTKGSRSGPTAQERLVLSLMELMQQGVAPWRKPWDGSGGGHHCNLISGHRYRGSNQILLTLGMHAGLAVRTSRCDGSAHLPVRRLSPALLVRLRRSQKPRYQSQGGLQGGDDPAAPAASAGRGAGGGSAGAGWLQQEQPGVAAKFRLENKDRISLLRQRYLRS